MATRLQSYSQLLEDCYAHQNLINRNQADISLVEIGAFDGIRYSNTLMLEKALGTPPAFLVEPAPKSAMSARKNRPASKVLEIAISSEFGIAEFAGDTAVSGLTEYFTSSYRRRWGIDDFQRHKTLTAPMHAVQEVINRPYIDFLSIDVQGAERYVLETTNWRIPIGTICIELEGHRPSDDEKCRLILADNGFVLVERLMISEIWTNPSYKRAKGLFEPSLQMPLSQYDLSPYAEKHLPSLMRHFK